ncbi:putative catecholamine binding [Fragilaria crotonensis]|nr:putative catecholamine binding [Fragilaria crotonensis]
MPTPTPTLRHGVTYLPLLLLLLLLSVAHCSAAKKSSPDRDLWTAHGATAATAWGILVPLAIGSSFIRRLLEAIVLPKGAWFHLHRGLNALAAILTIVAFSIAVHTMSKEGYEEHFSINSHHTVGLILFILTLLQALNGVFRPHLPPGSEEVSAANVKSHDDTTVEEEAQHQLGNDNLQTEESTNIVANKSTVRIVWEFGHRILGVGLLAMSWWQVQSGLGLFVVRFQDANNLSSVFFGVAGGICGVVFILFIVQMFVLKKKQ